jgi:type IV secretion system protein VirD4
MVDAATAASDFDLADLRRRPTTIYVAVSLDQLTSAARLLNLFLQQAISLLTERLPGSDERHRVLLLLDEFTSLGRMDVLKDSLAFLAGYGVRICTIVQGLGQLDDLYGRAGREAILQNSALQVLFAPTMIRPRATFRSGLEQRRFAPCRGASQAEGSKTYGSTGRALLLPEEVRGLRADCVGNRPIASAQYSSTGTLYPASRSNMRSPLAPLRKCDRALRS